MMEYDYLIVGAGLFGAVFAHEMKNKGKKILVMDRRPHVAGNAYTREEEGIQVHEYGAHIFHTNDDAVWEYVNRFASFNNYINSPIAYYRDEVYNLPFNMNTFSRMWGIKTPDEARKIIDSQVREAGITEPKNLEEQAISLVGKDVYEKLVKEYTQKQWGRECRDLPAFIIKRLPLRFSYDNNYFNAAHQGIPIGGFTKMAEKMLEGVDVRLGEDFLDLRKRGYRFSDGSGISFGKLIYTGMIDEYFDYSLGELEYRSLKFVHETKDTPNFQGNAVVNHTSKEVPYTRSIEHKFFEMKDVPKTIVTYEYPDAFERGKEPYYSINDEKNTVLYGKYKELSKKEKNVVFCGRLGSYRYYDMDQVIGEALKLSSDET